VSFARSLVVLFILLAVGIAGYQIGISQQIAAVAPGAAPAVAPVAYGYYPWHMGFGFGFLGFLFPLFLFFIFFGLLRAAFWGGRGGWGGHYRGRQWDRLEEIHKELHGEKTDRPSGGPSGTAT
jgi:hypothetical protein